MTEHEPTEDIPYDPTIDDFAFEDASATSNDDQLAPDNQLVKEINEYCDKAIEEHNSFDALNIPQNATTQQKIAVFDEMFNHKGLVHHLRQIKQIINEKVKEN